MNQKEKLYQATKGSGLSDYVLFNQDLKDKEKDMFLSLMTKALLKDEWFEVSTFKSLGERSFQRDITQVPYADSDVKDEEYTTLTRIFNKDEIDDIINIIADMKSYGVKAIKELMDEEELPTKNRWMRSAFLSPFFSKK
jgi:hypothetical protein